MRPLRPLLVFCAVVVALSAAFITAYRTTFRLPDGVGPAHVASVVAILTGGLLLATSLQCAVRRPTRLVALPLALIVLATADPAIVSALRTALAENVATILPAKLSVRK